MASHCHVLIVEDDPLIVEVLVASLELEAGAAPAAHLHLGSRVAT